MSQLPEHKDEETPLDDVTIHGDSGDDVDLSIAKQMSLMTIQSNNTGNIIENPNTENPNDPNILENSNQNNYSANNVNNGQAEMKNNDRNNDDDQNQFPTIVAAQDEIRAAIQLLRDNGYLEKQITCNTLSEAQDKDIAVPRPQRLK